MRSATGNGASVGIAVAVAVAVVVAIAIAVALAVGRVVRIRALGRAALGSLRGRHGNCSLCCSRRDRRRRDELELV